MHGALAQQPLQSYWESVHTTTRLSAFSHAVGTWWRTIYSLRSPHYQLHNSPALIKTGSSQRTICTALVEVVNPLIQYDSVSA